MKISIITVVYNAVDTFQRTINSVVCQKNENIEYIVVDGGSTDGTVELIKKNENNIHYWISEPDNGIYDAMNKGIKMASGDIIGIINADDWYEENAISEVERVFLETDAEIVYGALNYFYEDRTEKSKYVDINYLPWSMVIPHPASFVKREVYDRLGLFNTEYRIAADFEFMNRAFKNHIKFEHVERVYANFSMNGISNTNSDLCRNETNDIVDKYFNSEMFCDLLPYSKNIGIAIFGAGIWGRRMLNLLKNKGYIASCFIDNDSKKWNTILDEVNIFSPDYLRKYDGCVLIMSEVYEREIYEQLLKMALKCQIVRFSEIINDLYNDCLIAKD